MGTWKGGKSSLSGSESFLVESVEPGRQLGRHVSKVVQHHPTSNPKSPSRAWKALGTSTVCAQKLPRSALCFAGRLLRVRKIHVAEWGSVSVGEPRAGASLPRPVIALPEPHPDTMLCIGPHALTGRPWQHQLSLPTFVPARRPNLHREEHRHHQARGKRRPPPSHFSSPNLWCASINSSHTL